MNGWAWLLSFAAVLLALAVLALLVDVQIATRREYTITWRRKVWRESADPYADPDDDTDELLGRDE